MLGSPPIPSFATDTGLALALPREARSEVEAEVHTRANQVKRSTEMKPQLLTHVFVIMHCLLWSPKFVEIYVHCYYMIMKAGSGPGMRL